MIRQKLSILKCGFLKKSFIINAPLVSCPFPVITFGLVQQQTHPKVMTGNGQLTRGAFIINDFVRNPHFSRWFFIVSTIKNKRRNFSSFLLESFLWYSFQKIYLCNDIVWELKSDISSSIIKSNLSSKNKENYHHNVQSKEHFSIQF